MDGRRDPNAEAERTFTKKKILFTCLFKRKLIPNAKSPMGHFPRVSEYVNRRVSDSVDIVSNHYKRAAAPAAVAMVAVAMIQIPRAFVKRFGELIIMSKQFQLKTADSGNFWKVEVANANERMYFQKGWEVFVKDNKLEYGDFITFKYVGNSAFKVKMYGSHGCEKKLVHVHHHHVETSSNEEKRKKVVEDEVEDVIEMMKQNKARSLRNQIPPSKRRKGSADKEIHSKNKEVIHIDLDTSVHNEIEDCKGFVKKQSMSGEVEKGESHSAFALEEANRFKSKYPSFHAVITHYNAKFCLYLPSTFYRKHVKKEKIEKQNIKLECSGRVWNVALIKNGNGQPNYAKLSGGWGAFCKDNKLKVGDVCVFELRENAHLKVHIFRGKVSSRLCET
ncbi:putative B3 domain-containing protein [Senna tora]|uniref:Putative B3 domain-containing protein n=1 Tax=Senna tora TaxID=362788 RepID=A0A834T2B0_9FABA|nr:putative B3 domain-containing protein [Senna tora]